MLPPLLERDRNGLRLLVVVHQLGLLDVEQGGQRLIGGAGHLVVPGGNRGGGLALGVLGGILADLANYSMKYTEIAGNLMNRLIITFIFVVAGAIGSYIFYYKHHTKDMY